MNRCKTCRHFKPSTEGYDAPHMGVCDSEKFVYTEDVVKIPIDGLGYWDFDGYMAGFEVGEEFGCIHHEPRGSVA